MWSNPNQISVHRSILSHSTSGEVITRIANRSTLSPEEGSYIFTLSRCFHCLAISLHNATPGHWLEGLLGCKDTLSAYSHDRFKLLALNPTHCLPSALQWFPHFASLISRFHQLADVSKMWIVIGLHSLPIRYLTYCDTSPLPCIAHPNANLVSFGRRSYRGISK